MKKRVKLNSLLLEGGKSNANINASDESLVQTLMELNSGRVLTNMDTEIPETAPPREENDNPEITTLEEQVYTLALETSLEPVIGNSLRRKHTRYINTPTTTRKTG